MTRSRLAPWHYIRSHHLLLHLIEQVYQLERSLELTTANRTLAEATLARRHRTERLLKQNESRRLCGPTTLWPDADEPKELTTEPTYLPS